MEEDGIKMEGSNSMYTFETIVRYSECNGKEQAGLTNILDYLQDVCTFQAEELHVGVKYMRQHHIAWVLNSWQVDILRYPLFGEKIRITTWPYDFYGFYGFRNFKIEDVAGDMIVRANSVWVFMDTQKGRPVKILPQVQAAYHKESRLDMEYLDRKIPDFDASPVEEKIQIPRGFIDTNEHVNNAKYIAIAQELFLQGVEVARMCAEYRKSAVYGDVLYPSVRREPGKIAVKLYGPDGAVYTVMEFYVKGVIL